MAITFQFCIMTTAFASVYVSTYLPSSIEKQILSTIFRCRIRIRLSGMLQDIFLPFLTLSHLLPPSHKSIITLNLRTRNCLAYNQANVSFVLQGVLYWNSLQDVEHHRPRY